jgi:hypothetical protein
MGGDERVQVEAVAAAILEHLSTHPLAADSVFGVARWWLGVTNASATLRQVELALNLLVARKAMRRVKLLDGTSLYSQLPATRQ